MSYTDNPIEDFNRWDAEQTEQLKRLPKCAECGKPIQDEECYEINDELICPNCLEENHRKQTSDYIE